MTRLTSRTALLPATAVLGASLLLAGCTATAVSSPASTTAPTTVTSVDTSASSGEIDWSSLPTTEIALTDDGLTITDAGTYVLSGSTTGSVVVDSVGNVRLILNGVTIDSASGAAIEILSADNAVIELADGTTNTLSDSATRSDAAIDGALFSADDLIIAGTGSLSVTAAYADGIVGNDDVTIESGTVTVTSVDDGIRGKDSLTVSGGTLAITASGDALKASNDVDAGKGQLVVSGGDITITAGDDAITSEQQIAITGGTITIAQSVEGIAAPVVAISGGDIAISASDDGVNAAASAIVTSGLSITISGGTLAIVMGEGDTDAIDSNGDLTITGGAITITAQSATDFDGTGTFTGGSLTVNGETVTELTRQMMGGGPQG